jgi:hypothetical protein
VCREKDDGDEDVAWWQSVYQPCPRTNDLGSIPSSTKKKKKKEKEGNGNKKEEQIIIIMK